MGLEKYHRSTRIKYLTEWLRGRAGLLTADYCAEYPCRSFGLECRTLRSISLYMKACDLTKVIDQTRTPFDMHLSFTLIVSSIVYGFAVQAQCIAGEVHGASSHEYFSQPFRPRFDRRLACRAALRLVVPAAPSQRASPTMAASRLAGRTVSALAVRPLWPRTQPPSHILIDNVL